MNTMAASVWEPGKYGSGIHFDGTSDYLSLADNSALTPQSMTWETWVRFDQLASTLGYDEFILEHDNSVSPFFAYELYLKAASNKITAKVVNSTNTDKH